MRRQTHLFIGTIAFFAYTFPLYLFLQISPAMVLPGFFATAFGSVMPDVLEPARHRGHRGIGHSRRAMRLAGWVFVLTAVLGLFQAADRALSFSYIVSCFFLGYALHLLADGTTPAGLPE